MSATEEQNRRMLRARDAMDRTYAEPLDICALAKIAGASEAHFIRTFKGAFGETPHRYLQRRRIERAMWFLRETERSVTDICFGIGFTSLGTFSRTFHKIVGASPIEFRRTGAVANAAVKQPPGCFVMAWARPSSLRVA
jgi:transcriptional regulator GlxA family with amidase domain